ncbi:tRNA uridine 5-carboxymethylaminomethyl modification enzyme MnmG [bacterium BMS3Bbin07]|nr:tRNA uridine 5-carboxymethylaminomethyl modification enzyme MnmG [bacterium BMS3Bbin07]
MEMVERMKRIEGRTIPSDFKFDRISGLSREVLRKLEEVRPSSVGEASRIPGVTPAAIALVMIALEKKRREKSRQ